jgi:uncharacterized membrane protein required for colicin V production
MWLDVLALILLGVFAGVGALRGGLAAGLALLTLAGSYFAGIALAPRLGPGLAEALGTAPWAGLALAGSLGFVAGFLGLSLLSLLLRRAERRRADGSRSPRDRFVGGLFGALRGALLVLLLSYLALWMEALRSTGTMQELPELGRSAAARATEAVVSAGVEAAVGDSGPAGRVAARLASRPGTALAELQGVLEHPGIAELQHDTFFWTQVEHGNVDAALHRASFVRLARDASLRRRLGELGLIDEAAVDDPRRFRDEVAQVLQELGPRLRGLRRDPALRELLEDPEVANAVQQGNHLALMTHPGFREVVARAMQGDPQQP